MARETKIGSLVERGVEQHGMHPRNRQKLQFLRKIVGGVLTRTSSRIGLFELVLSQERTARSSDPIWQIGHPAFDAARAFVEPFDSGTPLVGRFGDMFHGRYSTQPWSEAKPSFDLVAAWWADVLEASERTFETHELSEGLPAPVQFSAYTAYTFDQAFDYVMYHTGFHLGRVQQLLGIP